MSGGGTSPACRMSAPPQTAAPLALMLHMTAASLRAKSTSGLRTPKHCLTLQPPALPGYATSSKALIPSYAQDMMVISPAHLFSGAEM